MPSARVSELQLPLSVPAQQSGARHHVLPDEIVAARHELAARRQVLHRYGGDWASEERGSLGQATPEQQREQAEGDDDAPRPAEDWPRPEDEDATADDEVLQDCYIHRIP